MTILQAYSCRIIFSEALCCNAELSLEFDGITHQFSNRTRWKIEAFSQDRNSCWRRDTTRIHKYGSIFIVGNIILWNSRDILRELSGDDIYLNVQNEYQLVSLSYLRWGEQFLYRLKGSFSFLIIDTRNQKVIGLTDHFGFENIYYHKKEKESGGIIFSSSPAGLGCFEKIKKTINTEYLQDYLSLQSFEKGACIYREICLLPPAHILTIENSCFEIRQYWSLRDHSTQSDIPQMSPEYLRELLENAIRDRMEKCDNPAILLSGGLDSSTILALAAKRFRETCDIRQIQAISRFFREEHINSLRDEQQYAREICQNNNVQLTTCDEEIFSPLSYLPRFFERMGFFPYDPMSFVLLPVYQKAVQLGANELITGYGGDEIVSLPGMNVLPYILRQGKLLLLNTLITSHAEVYSLSRWGVLKSHVLAEVLPKSFSKIYHLLKRKRRAESHDESCLHPHLRKVLKERLNEHVLHKLKRYLPPNQLVEMNIQSGILNHCQTFFSYLSLTENCKFIHPLMDKNIAEFVSRVPLEEFLKDGWQRSLFRRAIKGLVPENIRLRKDKSTFSLPNHSYIKNERDMILDLVATNNSIAWDYIDKNRLMCWTETICSENKSEFETNLIALKTAMAVNVALFLDYSSKNH